MDDKMRLRGWLAAKNVNINCLGEYQDLGVCYQYDDRLHKFPQDEVFLSDGARICFLDGYVYNKDDFICQEGYYDWQKSFVVSMEKDTAAHLQRLRGAFCGYSYVKETRHVTIYTDHLSNKALYYYVEGDRWIFSDYVEPIVRVLRSNHIPYHFDATAAKYILTYGYMLDDSTFVQEIKRLLPGCYADIIQGDVQIKSYYKVPHTEEAMSEEEAIERIDRDFRQAVDREFAKDKEYGYRHLVDLSGGLDSRMVTWVAHDMGYKNQVNIAYSKMGYLDNRISAKVALKLGHEYLFKPLDDASWMYELDEMVLKNNGAALGLAMTGGNQLLKTLNHGMYGIEHTGMLGDVILSSYYQDENFSKGAPKYGYNQYSTKVRYEFDPKILEQYQTQEEFVIATRGILGMQTSYMVRQNYVETSSPFMDVDFLKTAFSIPFAYRKGHAIYLKWMDRKYPGTTEFGWEKWGGVKPKESHVILRKVKTTQRLAHGYLCKALHRQNLDSMNPADYWYASNPRIKEYLDGQFQERIGSPVLEEDLRNDMSRLYRDGGFTEKQQVLTVLGLIHLYFG